MTGKGGSRARVVELRAVGRGNGKRRQRLAQASQGAADALLPATRLLPRGGRGRRGGRGACSRRSSTTRARGHEVVRPPGGEVRRLRRWRRCGTAAVMRGAGHARVVEREGHVWLPRPSHRRRQAPHADGARRRGAEGGSRRSGGARGRIRRMQADAHPGRLPARRSDRRRVSTRGSAHAGRGRLHRVGARTQPPRSSRSHHSARFESRAGRPLPPRGRPAGRHGRPPGPPPATYGPAPVRAGPARRPRGRPAVRPAVRPRLKTVRTLLKNGPDPLAQPPWPGWPDHFGAVVRPDFEVVRTGGRPDLWGGPARLGGWSGPIWGVVRTGGRRSGHPPDRVEPTTYRTPVPI